MAEMTNCDAKHVSVFKNKKSMSHLNSEPKETSNSRYCKKLAQYIEKYIMHSAILSIAMANLSSYIHVNNLYVFQN